MLKGYDQALYEKGFQFNRNDDCIECPECDGSGEATYEVKRYGGLPGPDCLYEEVVLECKRCKGEGEIWPEDEDYCDE